MQLIRVKCRGSGQAERAVETLDGKRGLEAWRKLWHWCGRRAAEKRGLRASIDISAMTAMKSKSVKETREMLLEMDERLKKAEDCGKTINLEEVKTVIDVDG